MIQCTSIIPTLRRVDGSKTKQDAGSQVAMIRVVSISTVSVDSFSNSGRYDGHHHYVACRVSELGLEQRAVAAAVVIFMDMC